MTQTGEARPRVGAPEPRRRRSIGDGFDNRHNSLNFLRLVMAVTVIAAHTQTIGGYSLGFIANKTAIGTVAVYGFFAMSGYLIAASASRNSVGRYLWQRCLRILPGFWVCLLVTALFFGIIGYSTGGAPGHDRGLHYFLFAHTGALDFFTRNFFLHMHQYSIVGSPANVPAPANWNDSLWSLYFEFLCYLVLAGIAALGLLKRRGVVAVGAGALWIVEAYVMATSVHTLTFVESKLIMLLPIFLAGSLLYLYRDKIPDSGVLALACTAVLVVSLWLPFGSHLSLFLSSTTTFDVAAPLLAYPLLWLGIHLPLQRVGARNDYSYGVYIYAFPAQQLLAIWGAYRLGYWAYLFLGVGATVPFAVGSWWLVERHALRLKKLRFADVRSKLRV